MLLSKKWLDEFITVNNFSSRSYTEALTMSGSKVEGWSVESSELQNIVVGKVLAIKRHENADSLFICSLDIGKPEPIQIVTAATNVLENAYVPVALNNSIVAGGKKIKEGKLRGELSQGMLCSIEELGLSHGDFPYANADGIFLMEEPDLILGQDIREAIGINDTVFDFEITSNRPDCLSVRGLARETAATYSLPINLPVAKPKCSGGDVNELLSVKVDNPKLCLKYCAMAVKNVRIAPSPRWIRERLRASGVRPINNIVDITNYVMLEYGQPMHAFDLQHVKGGEIIVRNAEANEKITTLDGVIRELSSEMLVIADENSPSAVAGVMGGEWSGIYDDTTTVIFESACFDGASVRTTSKKLGLRTESSGRFEKGLDAQNCALALLRACELVEILNAGDVVNGMIDITGESKTPAQIPLDSNWINNFLGTDIPKEEMIRILKSLEFTVENDIITAPSFRGDIQGKADISEEIARIFGYNNIPTTAVRGMAQGTITEEQHFASMISNILLSQGHSEIVTYSFISPKYYDNINLPQDSSLRNCVKISNPFGEDTSVMRTTPIPSMLEILARNYNNRINQAALYEIATIYIPTTPKELPIEKKQIMLGSYSNNSDFYSMKGVVELLLSRAGITKWEFCADKTNPTFHFGRCAVLKINGEYAGTIGQIHPSVCNNYGIGADVLIAEIDFDTMLKNANFERSYKHLPKFPSSKRDLALVCDEEMPVVEINKILTLNIGKILEEITLFDVYRGKQVGDGKKSVAYSLTLRANDHTLTDIECNKAVDKALAALTQINVQLRA